MNTIKLIKIQLNYLSIPCIAVQCGLFRSRFLSQKGEDIEVLMAHPYHAVRLSHQQIPQGLIDEINRLNHLLPASSSELPFCGGVAGFLSYDYGAQSLGIQQPTHPARKDIPDCYLGFYDSCIVFNHHQKTATAVCLPMVEDSKKRFEALIQLYQQSTTPPRFFSSDFIPQISFAEYQQGFRAVHQALREGRCYQVNYTQPFVASFDGAPHAMYQYIAARNHVPYGAYIEDGKQAVLSFSPERFLQISDSHVLTSPIKGTAPRSIQPLKDTLQAVRLQNCPKNQAENVMIVDLMRNDLGKIAKAGSVKVSRLLAIESYPAVHHLVSDVEATLKADITPFEAFLSCFPGGSITGAPKIEAMKVISEVEPWGRGIYCGSVFMLSFDGRLESNIAIRTMSASQGQLVLQTGRAIVIDSDCQQEYEECETKALAIKRALSELSRKQHRLEIASKNFTHV